MIEGGGDKEEGLKDEDTMTLKQPYTLLLFMVANS